MYFFTADEHYNHGNIIKYCNRPFDNVNEMNETIILNHNSVVRQWHDTVIHCGDFAFGDTTTAKRIIKRLNGNHVFLQGSHDRWAKEVGGLLQIWEKKLDGQYVVACHYAMRVWARSHHGSWQVHGHSHGRLEPQGKQWDVGVDNNAFYPVSWDALKAIMEDSPDNFNKLRS